MTHGRREVHVGDRRIAYELRRAQRRTIGFQVGADGLAVRAPRWVSIADIEAALREKSGWIVRKLAETQAREARDRAARVEWRDGAQLPFLGRAVTVRLEPKAAAAATLDAAAAQLRLALAADAPAAEVGAAVQAWLQRQARRVFEQRCAEYAPRLGVRMKRLALSSAATRWGSASADGSVRLNWRLVHFELPVVDYVVAHELAHLHEMNHGPRFWALVASVLPAYEAARATLRDPVLPSFD